MPELGEDRRIASDIFGHAERVNKPASTSHVRARRRGEFQCRIMRTASVLAGFAFCGLRPVERLALRLPFGFLQEHPLRLQLRTFLDLGLDPINQGLRFRRAYFEGRTH
jgi:hypothetical protein